MEIELKKAFETFLPIFEFGLQKMTGCERRVYLAELAKCLGYGGMKLVSENFSVDFKTLQKGLEELESGNYIVDAFSERGRKSIETRLPNILVDIKGIVDSESQTDPRFEDNRLFTRLTPENIKTELHNKGYLLEDLPTNQTIYNKVNELGYSFSTIQKTKPIKRIAQTDAIFKKNKASQ
jgi:hypothetical protein